MNSAHLTPQEFVERAVASCRSLTDHGNQMHRRAAQGIPLVLSIQGLANSSGLAGRGRWAVALRLQGQSAEQGERVGMPTQSDQLQYAAAVQEILDRTPPPIPGEPHPPKRRGRPPLAAGAQRAPDTHPRSVRLTDAEWAELQTRGVRGGPGTLSHWLAKKSR